MNKDDRDTLIEEIAELVAHGTGHEPEEGDYYSADRIITLILDEVKGAVPANWCDPLLIGKSKVLRDGYIYTPTDIEALLLAIRKNIDNLRGERDE